MFTLYADKNLMTVQEREPVTSGSVNGYTVQFEFSSDWDGLNRTAVFQAGSVCRSVLLDESGTCSVPWEVLKTSGIPLSAGVYGEKGGDIVLPTTWAPLGLILKGAAPGEDAQPPTPELWKQDLDKKADRLRYDGTNLSLMCGEKELSSVEIPGGGEGVTPSIQEYDTDDGWHVRKWSDGYLEMVCTKSRTVLPDSWGAWGSFYSISSVNDLLPFTLTEKYSEQVTQTNNLNGNTSITIIPVTAQGSSVAQGKLLDKTNSWMFVRASKPTSSAQISYTISVTGRWK